MCMFEYNHTQKTDQIEHHTYSETIDTNRNNEISKEASIISRKLYSHNRMSAFMDT